MSSLKGSESSSERGEAVSVDFNCGSVNMEGTPVSQNLLRRIKGSTYRNEPASVIRHV